MSALLAESPVMGVQTPRLSWMPVGEWDNTLGDECVVWAREVLGVYLDPWEQLVLRMMLARRPDGRWVCPEFGMCLCRRNGKSHVLVIRFLFGLLKLGEMAAEYTAHHGRTARATFRLTQKILDKAPAGNVPGYQAYKSDGRERIDFATGQTLAFSTRTKSAGRGTGADTLAVDEAQEADDEEMDALSPTLGDQSMQVPGSQLIYAGSAGNYLSVVFGRVRRRALAREATRLGWAEWSIDDDAYFAADVMERAEVVLAVESIAQANPALELVREDGSTGLSLEWLRGQVDILSADGFAREHLGVGTWPKDDGFDWVIPRARWSAVARPEQAVPSGSLVFALSASWGDRSVSIAAAGGLGDGECYAWLERMDAGTSWVVPEVVRLVGATSCAAVLLDAGGPAAPLADPLEQALKPTGVQLVRLTGREVGNACGGLSDAVTADPPSFAHRGQPEVDAALAGAKKKDLGDGLWVFDRKHSQSPIAALEAVAIARHGWVIYGSAQSPQIHDWPDDDQIAEWEANP